MSMPIDWKPRAPDHRHWHRPVRWLHFALALTIILQLFTSVAMSSPASDGPPTQIGLSLFRVHEYLGIFATVVILLHWLWMPFDRHRLFSHLFPWGRRGREEIIEDFRNLARGELPTEGDRGGLSGMVHGFGLLAATAMGITGVGLYLLMNDPMAPFSYFNFIGDLHLAIGNLMWAYLGGHALLAVAHHFIGHPTLKRMFTW